MFTRFLNYAVDHCRDAAVQKAKLDFPDYRVVTVQVGEESGTELVALDAVATIAATEPDPEEEEEGEAAAEQKEDKMFVFHNQKDDYLHRGASAVLRHMSLLMYSRFVVRRPTERHKVDYYLILSIFGTLCAQSQLHTGRQILENVQNNVLFCVVCVFRLPFGF